ncbi:MAG: AAA family ATPase [Candidatus Lutacidiplasmatales archaeon]
MRLRAVVPRTASTSPERRPLTERARPARLSEMVGNRPAIEALRAWGRAWAASDRPPAQRAALLEGPAGTGKTTAALALAHEMGWTVVEMNASDARNQEAIEQVAGRAALAHTLGGEEGYRSPSEGGRALILLDEADCLTGRITEEAKPRRSPPALREFLRSRYGDVAELNGAWGLGEPGAPKRFETFDAVPLTGGRGAWTKLPAAQRDLADWRELDRPRDLTDRGGLPAIARLVRETLQPVVLTVNDPQSLAKAASSMRGALLRIRFRPVFDSDVRSLVERLATRERILLGPGTLDTVVRRARGDLRAAVNDLEALAPLPVGSRAESVLFGRDQTTDFYAFTREALTQPRFIRAGEIRDRLDASPDDLFPWIEENAPRVAKDRLGTYLALETLARAERHLSRARRYRVWGLWPFASELMSGGVGLALEGHADASANLSFPQYLSAMGQTRHLRAARQELLKKVGSHLHLSRRMAVDTTLPVLEGLFRHGSARSRSAAAERDRRAIARELELTAEEVAFLGGTPSDVPPAEEPGPARAERFEEFPSPPTAPSPVAAPKSARGVQRRLTDD